MALQYAQTAKIEHKTKKLALLCFFFDTGNFAKCLTLVSIFSDIKTDTYETITCGTYEGVSYDWPPFPSVPFPPLVIK